MLIDQLMALRLYSDKYSWNIHYLEQSRQYWQSLQGEKKDNFRFLHVSTDEVYGDLDGQMIIFQRKHPMILVHHIQPLKQALIIL